jgi:hypothetical protein
MKHGTRMSKRKVQEIAFTREEEKFRKSKRKAIRTCIFLVLGGSLFTVFPLVSDLPLSELRGGGKGGPASGWQCIAAGLFLFLAAAYSAYAISKMNRPNKALVLMPASVTAPAGQEPRQP